MTRLVVVLTDDRRRVVATSEPVPGAKTDRCRRFLVSISSEKADVPDVDVAATPVQLRERCHEKAG